MTILWIPHSPSSPGAVRRDEHLIRHLREEHRIISVTWETRRGSLTSTFAEGLRFYKKRLEDGRTEYHVRRIPDITRRLRGNAHDSFWLNQAMFRRDIRQIVSREDVDVLITAYSNHMTGLPPFDLDVPVVFDYLDCAEWGSDSPDEKPYLDQADLVLAVSSLAEEQARRFHDRVVFLPNGADVERIREASGEGVRHRHNLGDAKVLSLIGLMDSPYFLEAVLNAQESIPDLKCMLVGESDSIRRALSKMKAPHDTFVDVGSIPYTEVPSYLAASDVGVYPVPGISYDDGRSPIKIFEYTAAGCPVVAPPIREVKRLGFANLILAPPTAEDFASAIVEAFHTPVTTEPAIEQYSWRRIASRLNSQLTRLCIETK